MAERNRQGRGVQGRIMCVEVILGAPWSTTCGAFCPTKGVDALSSIVEMASVVI